MDQLVADKMYLFNIWVWYYFEPVLIGFTTLFLSILEQTLCFKKKTVGNLLSNLLAACQ